MHLTGSVGSGVGPMHSPGTGWGAFGSAPAGADGRGGCLPAAVAAMGSGGGGLSSVGWGGGQPPVGLVLQLPAALMHGPMMGPAHQDQVVQIGGAAIQPVDQMMSLTPGKGTITAGEDTAAVAHR